MKNMKIVTIIALAVMAWMVFVGCDDIFDQNKFIERHMIGIGIGRIPIRNW